jgi:zinc-finger binding domain of transposase IS66
MQPLGEDVSEQLARVEAMFKAIRTIRRKMVCPCGHHFSQPPIPGLPITRIAHPSLLADIPQRASHWPTQRPMLAGSSFTPSRAAICGRRHNGAWSAYFETPLRAADRGAAPLHDGTVEAVRG